MTARYIEGNLQDKTYLIGWTGSAGNDFINK